MNVFRLSMVRTVLLVASVMSIFLSVAFAVFVATTPALAQEEVAQEANQEDMTQEEVNDEPATISGNTRFMVAPVVITEKGRPRDIVKGSLTLRNATDRVVTLYADVYDVDPNRGAIETSFGTGGDHARSLANWIEITRGVIELGPDEEIQIPYLIHVNLRAEPGTYHAEIVFNEGANRLDATAEPRSSKTVFVTFEIGEDIIERLNLGAFISDASFITGGDAEFSYTLENSGNRPIAPRGMVRIYDRNGKEVGAVPINEGGETIAPNDTKHLEVRWPTDGRLGKYKAFLDLSYGMTGSVNDSAYVWVLPMRDLLIGLFLLLLVAGVVTYLLHARGAYLQPALAPSSRTITDDDEIPVEPEPAVASTVVPSVAQRRASAAVVKPARAHTIVSGTSNTPDSHAVHLTTERPAQSSQHVVRLGKR